MRLVALALLAMAGCVQSASRPPRPQTPSTWERSAQLPSRILAAEGLTHSERTAMLAGFSACQSRAAHYFRASNAELALRSCLEQADTMLEALQ